VVFQHNDTTYQINRYPHTNNESLKPWSAADEHILKYLDENNPKKKSISIHNDRFGFLSCLLHPLSPTTIITNKSQEKASLKNLAENQLQIVPESFLNPLATISTPIDLGIIKVPKSLKLFQFFLSQLSSALGSNSTVICSFMTKHFNSQLLVIAEKYFGEVGQSKAWKKSRLLILKKPKVNQESAIIDLILTNDKKKIKQYSGVFSGKHIDYATQFLIEHLDVPVEAERVLDLASGNGVLAMTVRDQHKDCELHLLDDFYLAVESSKLNLKEENTFFHYNDNLENFEAKYFDFIISNPPFHFEYEINIEVAISLFKAARDCLKDGGHFQLVANLHLNYKTHLVKIFKEVRVIARNKKFIIYDCS
jgi:23S rRNA (guanine1835-N2)-methyltransferase